MAVYKFKLFIEDNEDIYREIEILSGQTFEDFHNSIQDAYKFDKKHAASFFVSDDFWRKGTEVTLLKEDIAGMKITGEKIRRLLFAKMIYHWMRKKKVKMFLQKN